MGKTLSSMIRTLPDKRRTRIEARAAELIAEEMALRDLREAYHLTQVQMSKLLRIGQDNVSRIEQRGDLRLSTLRNYIKALGGSIRIVADFPDGKSFNLRDVCGKAKPRKRTRSKNSKKSGQGSDPSHVN